MISPLDSSQSYVSDYRQVGALAGVAAIDPSDARVGGDASEQQFEAVKARMLASDARGPRGDGPRQSDDGHDLTGGGPDANTFAPGVAGADPSADMFAFDGGAGSFDDANLSPALPGIVPMIDAALPATGVSPAVITAMLYRDLNGAPNAPLINPGNGDTDVGLMQIDPGTFANLQQKHRELQGGRTWLQSLRDPATDIVASNYLMSDLLKQYGGNLNVALRAYDSNGFDPSKSNRTANATGVRHGACSFDCTSFALQGRRRFPA